MLRDSRMGAIVAVDERGRGITGWLPYRYAPHYYEEWLKEWLLPGSRIVLWDMPMSPVVRAAQRLAIPVFEINPAAVRAAQRVRPLRMLAGRWLKPNRHLIPPVPVGPETELSVHQARRYADQLHRWLRRFRGFPRGSRAYEVWYEVLRSAASPEEFIDRCIESWRVPPPHQGPLDQQH
jgi:hypothetical protein